MLNMQRIDERCQFDFSKLEFLRDDEYDVIEGDDEWLPMETTSSSCKPGAVAFKRRNKKTVWKNPRCNGLTHASVPLVLTDCIGTQAVISECAAHPFRPDIEAGTLRWWASLSRGRRQIQQHCEELTLTCPSDFGFMILTRCPPDTWTKVTTLRVQECHRQPQREYHECHLSHSFGKFLRLCTPSLKTLIIEGPRQHEFESDLLLNALCRGTLPDMDTAVCMDSYSGFFVNNYSRAVVNDSYIRLPKKTALRALGPLVNPHNVSRFFNLSVGPNSLSKLRCLSMKIGGGRNLEDLCKGLVGKTPVLTELFIFLDSVRMIILSHLF